MRIITINFENINSLQGRHSLELDKLCQNSKHLFAIVGPTGSGKTTILDSLTLALYGRTPRIQQSFSELVSRGEKKAFAEVVFACKNQKYLSRWSITAQKKSLIKMSLSTWCEKEKAWSTLLASGVRQSQKAVEEISGLDYERFTRSILLAQGSFAAFIQSKAKERSQILEKITGTQIYSKLSQKTYEKFKQAQAKIEDFAEKIKTLRFEQEKITEKNTTSDLKSLSEEKELLEKKLTAEKFRLKIEREKSLKLEEIKALEGNLKAELKNSKKISEHELSLSKQQNFSQISFYYKMWQESKSKKEMLNRKLSSQEKLLPSLKNKLSFCLSSHKRYEEIAKKISQKLEVFKQEEDEENSAKNAGQVLEKISSLHKNLAEREEFYRKEKKELTIQKLSLGLEYKALKQYEKKESLKHSEASRYFQKKLEKNRSIWWTLSLKIAALYEKIKLSVELKQSLEEILVQKPSGGKKDKIYRKKLDKIYKKIKAILNRKKEKSQVLQKKSSFLSQELQVLAEKISREEELAAEIHQNLQSQTKKLNIKDLSCLEKDLLSPTQEKNLRLEVKNWHEKKAYLEKRFLEEEKNYQELSEKNSALLNKEKISHAELKNYEKRLEILQEEIIYLKFEKTRFDKLKEKEKKIGEEEKKFLKEFKTLEKLCELIGSADGQKFRKYAQSLNMKRLIHQSNHYLAELQDRYHLSYTPGDELEFTMIDFWQKKEKRPVTNLSGGETFLLSLALSLGLAKMASQEHPIKTLFIDEGFGTLDKKHLEQALKALESWKTKDHVIGIISHLDILKEKIPSHVEVKKSLAGKSKLESFLH